MPDIASKIDDSLPLPALSAQPLARRWIWLGALGLIIVTALAYHNAFTVPFLFDDEGSISSNESIRSWRTVLFPPGDTGDTVGGRPLLNITLAINYAINGTTGTWSYHLFNVLIHLVSGLALFGLVRRTLEGRGATGVRWGERDAFFCALAASLLWMLHPLQTESVTYIVQRAESLMSMLYLLTLYCFARAMSHDTVKPRRWLVLSVVACALGMASKEVMVSAPVMVFLYDRAFVAGSFKAAWRARWKFYVILCATWLVLAACLLNSGFRGGTAGFGTPVTWWMYAITQSYAILTYIKLAFWPSPLVFDYGVFFIINPLMVWWQIIVVLLLVAAALVAMFRFPRAGIFGALFFAVLAPSSSFIPVVSQTMAEHRMYLPLAAIVVPIVVACYWFVRRRRKMPLNVAAAVVACAVAITFGVLVWQRNHVLQDVVGIWQDTVNKMPWSHRAQNNIGCALIDAKRYEEGIAHCMEAVRLKPDYGETYGNVGYGLSGAKRFEEAIPYYQQALFYMRKIGLTNLDRVLLNMGLAMHEVRRDAEARKAFEEAAAINPKNAPALNNVGNYEFMDGRYAEAKKYYQKAVEADPQFAEAWYDLGNAVFSLGEPWSEVERLYRHALEIDPELTIARDNLARLLLQMNRPDEAAAYFDKVIKENPNVIAKLSAAKAFMLATGNPDYRASQTAKAIPLLQDALKDNLNNLQATEATYMLGNAYYRLGDTDAAIASYRKAILLNPYTVETHGNLGSMLASAGKWDEAITELNVAVQLNPDYADAHYNLANALFQVGRVDEARAHYEAAIQLITNKPMQLAQAHYYYARLLQSTGEIEAARAHAQEAIKLRPDFSDAVEFLKTLPSAPAS